MRSDDELLSLLERIHDEVRDVRRDLRPEDRLREDLGLDSLAAAEMLNALEDELGVQLDGDGRIDRLDTVADVLDVIRTSPAA
jgi:acyl carrier protein